MTEELGAVRLAADLAAGKVASRSRRPASRGSRRTSRGCRRWAHLDPDHARAQAKALDERKRAGLPLGPLHGLPVAVKDIVDTRDFPTENGSVLRGRRPLRDAAIVVRLRAAGAVLLGKTVTTEFACFAPGKTRNPHDLARTPGGSSSGSAASVAAGMAPLAIGSQTNGSVIRPASFCGVFGFKPTRPDPAHRRAPTSATLDHVGVFARSIEDLALLAEPLVGFDTGDPATRPLPPPPRGAWPRSRRPCHRASRSSGGRPGTRPSPRPGGFRRAGRRLGRAVGRRRAARALRRSRRRAPHHLDGRARLPPRRRARARPRPAEPPAARATGCRPGDLGPRLPAGPRDPPPLPAGWDVSRLRRRGHRPPPRARPPSGSRPPAAPPSARSGRSPAPPP